MDDAGAACPFVKIVHVLQLLTPFIIKVQDCLWVLIEPGRGAKTEGVIFAPKSILDDDKSKGKHSLAQDDVLLMLVSLKNRSAVSYELSEPGFAIESSRRLRRGLQMERAVFPKQVYGLGPVAPGAEGRFVFAFDKLALVRGQVMRVYLYEAGGVRNLVMEVGRKDVEGGEEVGVIGMIFAAGFMTPLGC